MSSEDGGTASANGDARPGFHPHSGCVGFTTRCSMNFDASGAAYSASASKAGHDHAVTANNGPLSFTVLDRSQSQAKPASPKR